MDRWHWAAGGRRMLLAVGVRGPCTCPLSECPGLPIGPITELLSISHAHDAKCAIRVPSQDVAQKHLDMHVPCE